MDCASRTFFFRTDTDEDCAEWVQTLLAEIPATPSSPLSSKPAATESQRIEAGDFRAVNISALAHPSFH